MKLDDLNLEPNFIWNFHRSLNENLENLDFSNRKQMFDTFKPFVSVDIEEMQPLYEATYKEIASLIDPYFLDQHVRAEALQNIRLMGFDGNTMLFNVDSDTVAKKYNTQFPYSVRVQFPQWDEIAQDQDLKNYNERARLLLWVGDIKLDCTCPSFLYWGYQYILTVLDAAIEPETRVPKIRNPKDRGVVCKHANRVLRVLPFMMGDIAKEMKRQFG